MTVIAFLFRRPSIVVVLLACLSGGCGRGGPELATVHGVVTFQGKPLADAAVMFVPKTNGRPATGTTDSQGGFVLTTFRDGDGASVGEHGVIVTKVPPQSAASAPKNNEAGANGRVDFVAQSRRATFAPKSLIPAKYGQCETSDLSAKVVSGDNRFVFDLLP